MNGERKRENEEQWMPSAHTYSSMHAPSVADLVVVNRPPLRLEAVYDVNQVRIESQCLRVLHRASQETSNAIAIRKYTSRTCLTVTVVGKHDTC